MIFPPFLTDVILYTNQNIYLVGGIVRDIYLDLEPCDYDILCQESAISLAYHLRDQNLATIISIHEPFGTAKIQWHDQTIIDLATMRRETYIHAGALPDVQYPSSLSEDLYRRDFSINTLALPLSSEALLNPLNHIIDLHNGLNDIREGRLRVLHQDSYLEDPTRIIRGIRFAARFDFQLTDIDLILIDQILSNSQYHGIIYYIRGLRFGIELSRILELDYHPKIKALQLLCKLKADCLYHRSWRFDLEYIIQNKSITSIDLQLYSLIAHCSLDWSSIAQYLQLLGIYKLYYLETLHSICTYSGIIAQYPLNLYKKYLQLPKPYQEYILHQNKDTIDILQQAYPTISPQELLKQNIPAKRIGSELEYIFHQNIQNIIINS